MRPVSPTISPRRNPIRVRVYSHETPIVSLAPADTSPTLGVVTSYMVERQRGKFVPGTNVAVSCPSSWKTAQRSTPKKRHYLTVYKSILMDKFLHLQALQMKHFEITNILPDLV
jgi:hypothetical protein